MTGLLDLPPEVLANVYDWLRVIEAPPDEQDYYSPEPTRTWAPVCRALRPFTQAYRFRIVVLRKHAQVRFFSEAVVSSPSLGDAVRRLSFAGMYHWHAPAGSAADGWQAVLDPVWGRLSQLRALVICQAEVVWEILVEAIEEGLELPLLEALELGDCFDVSADPAIDHELWAAVLVAVPSLNMLDIRFVYEDYQDEMDDDFDVSLGPPFSTNVSVLKVAGFPSSLEPALAAFINAFPSLANLDLYSGTDHLQPRISPLLRAPHARSLTFGWFTERGVNEPFASLDLRHLPALEHLTFASDACTPEFCFRFPPGLARLTLDVSNTFPLAALVALVTPGAPAHQPVLHRPAVRARPRQGD